jgi:hypothetical protein
MSVSMRYRDHNINGNECSVNYVFVCNIHCNLSFVTHIMLYSVSNEDQGTCVPRYNLQRHTSIFYVYKWQNSSTLISTLASACRTFSLKEWLFFPVFTAVTFTFILGDTGARKIRIRCPKFVICSGYKRLGGPGRTSSVLSGMMPRVRSSSLHSESLQSIHSHRPILCYAPWHLCCK